MTEKNIYDVVHEQQREAFSPLGAMADMFIQWKGTDVCMDFYCKCGACHHIDAAFVYHVHCEDCGRTYALGSRVVAVDVTGTPQEAEALDACVVRCKDDEP